jgi:lysyl-tRNA synthetase class 2
VDAEVVASLEGQIRAVGDAVRALKSQQGDASFVDNKDAVSSKVAELKALKASFEIAAGRPFDPPKPPKKKKATPPPTPKGGNKKGLKKKPPVSDNSDDEVPVRELRANRLAKVDEMIASGIDPYAYSFALTHSSAQLASEFDGLEAGEEDPQAQVVALAGRVLTRRVFGKLMFFTVQDESGTFQLYAEKGKGEGGGTTCSSGLSAQRFNELKSWSDGGDLVGVKGTVKRTDKGELSVVVQEWTMLTKALLPLPDKFKGFTDVSKRYRQRHLDMIVNPEVRTPCVGGGDDGGGGGGRVMRYEARGCRWR